MSSKISTSSNKAWLRAGVALIVFVLVVATIVIFDPDNLTSDQGLSRHHRDRLDGRIALFAAAFRLSFRDGARLRISELFKLMERRLLKVIMNPAMMLAWLFGSISLDSLSFPGRLAACEAVFRRGADRRACLSQPRASCLPQRRSAENSTALAHHERSPQLRDDRHRADGGVETLLIYLAKAEHFWHSGLCDVADEALPLQTCFSASRHVQYPFTHASPSEPVSVISPCI